MPQRETTLRCFIASSTEGLQIARAIQTELDPFAELVVWTQGVIPPGSSTLAGLISELKRVDFAVLVLTPDDLSERVSKPGGVFSPRDNVVLELGMSLIELGPERAFIVHSRDDVLDLPSDLAGIETIRFTPHSNGNLLGAVGPACYKIETAMRRLGSRTRAAEPLTETPNRASAASTAGAPTNPPADVTIDDAQAELLGLLAEAEREFQDLDRSMLVERADHDGVRANYALAELCRVGYVQVADGLVFEKVTLTHAGRGWLLSATSIAASRPDRQARTFTLRATNWANGKQSETLTLEEVLVAVGSVFLTSSRALSDGEIEASLARYIERARYNDMKQNLRLNIHEDDYNRIKMHLLSTGVIREAAEQHEEIALWVLTQRGRRLALEASDRDSIGG